MVHNPLYDRRGPQYEFVPSRLESSAQFTRPVVDETRATHPHYDTINTPRFSSQQDMPTADTHRNVDQPHSADRSSHRPSKFHSVRALSSSNTHNLPYDIISTSTSSSVPAPTFGLMGLKKNGQERNKLHLTLSLGNVDRIVGTHAPGRIHEVLTSDSESDNYTFLNPIASRQNAGFNILPDAQNDTLV